GIGSAPEPSPPRARAQGTIQIISVKLKTTGPFDPLRHRSAQESTIQPKRPHEMMNRRFGSVPSMPTTPAVNSTSPNRGRRHSSLLGGCGFLLALVTASDWPTVCLSSGKCYVGGSSISCYAPGPGADGEPCSSLSAT